MQAACNLPALTGGMLCSVVLAFNYPPSLEFHVGWLSDMDIPEPLVSISTKRHMQLLLDHRLMTLMKRMPGRGYRGGCCAQNDCNRKSNLCFRGHHLISLPIWRGVVQTLLSLPGLANRPRIMPRPEVTRFDRDQLRQFSSRRLARASKCPEGNHISALGKC